MRFDGGVRACCGQSTTVPRIRHTALSLTQHCITSIYIQGAWTNFDIVLACNLLSVLVPALMILKWNLSAQFIASSLSRSSSPSSSHTFHQVPSSTPLTVPQSTIIARKPSLIVHNASPSSFNVAQSARTGTSSSRARSSVKLSFSPHPSL